MIAALTMGRPALVLLNLIDRDPAGVLRTLGGGTMASA